MKNLLILLSMTAIYTGCSSPSTTQTSVDSTVKTSTTVTVVKPASGNYHFIHAEGKNTTSVDITVTGERVTGNMNWMPFEKDARKGKLEGRMNGDTAHVTWTFMQEGMADTLALNFLLQNGNLSQKPLKLNSKTGREQTDETSGYTLMYQTSSGTGK